LGLSRSIYLVTLIQSSRGCTKQILVTVLLSVRCFRRQLREVKSFRHQRGAIPSISETFVNILHNLVLLHNVTPLPNPDVVIKRWKQQEGSSQEETMFLFQVALKCNSRQECCSIESHCFGMPGTYGTSRSLTAISANFLRVACTYEVL
jgi:hypothetical protein